MNITVKFCCWLAITLLLSSPGWAQPTTTRIEGDVFAGSKDNVAPILLINSTSVSVTGVRVSVGNASDLVRNFHIEPALIKSLGAGETQEFAFYFDVAEEAEADSQATVKFIISAESGKLEATTAEVLLTVLRDEVASESLTAESGEHVLHLIEIEHPKTASSSTRKWEFAENSPGFVLSESTLINVYSGERVQDAKTSMGFSKLPKQITLGRPFSIVIGGQKQIERSSGNCFDGGKTKSKLNMWVDVTHEHAFSGTANSDVLDLECKAPEMGFTTGEQHGGYSLGVDLSVTVNCNFLEKTSNANNDSFKYEYNCTAESAVDNQSDPRSITLRWPKSRMRLFTLGIGEHWGLAVYYGDDTNPDSFNESGYEHPFELVTSLHGSGGEGESGQTAVADSGHEGGDTTNTPEDDTGDAESTITETEGTQIADQSSGPETIPARTGSIDSRGVPVNPSDPAIATLISQWIGIAEPPQNATEGGDFRYNEWAQLQGTSAKDGRATPGVRPDAAGAQTSVEYLWSVRDKKDSVDHCTLGEYVEKKFAGESIANCSGRYKPVVPELVGQPAKTAKDALNRLKLTASIKAGRPAPAKGLEGKVERQGVPSHTEIARGSTVEIWVHIAYVRDQITLVNWVGKPVAEAKAELERAGIRVSIGLGSPAPSAGASGTVESQNPQGGMRVISGAEVSLLVHSRFVNQVTLDDFRGVAVASAKSTLEKQRLKVAIRVGTPASNAANSGTVETQSPMPGLRVARGSEVALTVYSRFSNTIRVPGVVGQSFQQASATLQRAGLQVQHSGGGSGSNTAVASQTPAANMNVLHGSTIQVVLQAASAVPGLPANSNPASSSTGSTSREVVTPQPNSLRCPINIPGLVLDKAPSYTANGRVNKSKLTSSYGCFYRYQGESTLIEGHWYHASPSGNDSPYSIRSFGEDCDASSERAKLKHVFGIGTTGKAAYVLFQGRKARTNAGVKQQIVDFYLQQVLPYSVSCSGGLQVATTPAWINPLDAAGIRLPAGVRLLDPKPQRSVNKCTASPIDRNPIYILTTDFANCKAPWIIDGKGQYKGTWGRFCAWCPAGTNWVSGIGCCQGSAGPPASRPSTSVPGGNSGTHTSNPVGSGSLCCPSGWTHTSGLLGDLGACQRWQGGKVVESRDMGHHLSNGTCRF